MSEFGKGLCYCLGLFLAHEENIHQYLESYKSTAYSMWFYAAADHVSELRWEDAPKGLKTRCKRFGNKVWNLRLPLDNSATKEDFHWAVKEAKTLLRLIDKANGVQVEEGEYE